MANRCYQLTLEGLVQGSYKACVLHFQSTGTNDNDTLAGAESLVNGFNTSAVTNFLATQAATYFLTRLVARRVITKPSATACKQYLVGTQVGTRPNPSTALQTCPSVLLVPTMGVKSGGRIFLPSLSVGDLNANVYLTAYLTAVNTFINGLVSGFTNSGITWTLAIFSRKTGGISNVSSHSMSPVIGYVGKRRKPVGGVG